MGTFRATFDVRSPRAPLGASRRARRHGRELHLGLARRARPPGNRAARRLAFEIAGGAVIQRDAGEAPVQDEGDVVTAIVVFGDEASTPLLGAYTLEGFSLALDPVNRRLVTVRALAMATRDCR